MRWQIPTPLPVDWQMRGLDSARISEGPLEHGRYRIRIEHAPLPGITIEMCLWHFERLGSEITWRGTTVPYYRLWHPVDHIYFKPIGRFGPGCRFHIVEAFGGERRWLTDTVYDVPRLDDSGVTLESRVLGRVAAHTEESWQPSPQGLLWTVEATFGFAGPPQSWLNQPVMRRLLPLVERWRLHNVEEDGNLPHFLPEVFAATS